MSTPAIPKITIDLVLDRHTAKEVLRGTLHSILFHRLFGNFKPQTFEVLDVTMPGVSDAEIEKLVDDKVDAFWNSGGVSKQGQITITFSEKRKKTSWFYSGEEDVPWEQWIVNAEVRQLNTDRERQASTAALATALSRALQTMLTHTTSDRGREAVPPITTTSGISPFPINIAVSVNGVDVP